MHDDLRFFVYQTFKYTQKADESCVLYPPLIDTVFSDKRSCNESILIMTNHGSERYDLTNNNTAPITTRNIDNLCGMDADQNEELVVFSDLGSMSIYRKSYVTRDEATAIKQDVWGE